MPCFDRGLITALAARFKPEGAFVAVALDPAQPTRKRGGETCTFLVTWQLPGFPVLLPGPRGPGGGGELEGQQSRAPQVSLHRFAHIHAIPAIETAG